MFLCVVLCCAVSCRALLCCAVLCCVALCCAVLCWDMLCCIGLCVFYVVLFCAVICAAVLCCVLWYSLLCFAVLYCCIIIVSVWLRPLILKPQVGRNFHFVPIDRMVVKMMTVRKGNVQLNMGSVPRWGAWYSSHTQSFFRGEEMGRLPVNCALDVVGSKPETLGSSTVVVNGEM
jgi:hypothetical protein